MKVIFMMLGLIVMAACNTTDSREECCCGQCSVVDFRYYYKNMDHFDTYISSVRYFLFDATDGHYMGEMYGNDDDISVVDLDGLWSGSYSLVAIGNLEEYGTVTGLDEGLDALRLVIDDYYDGTSDRASSNPFANGDPIYWGQCDFDYDNTVTQVTFTGDMNNIHLRLLIRVEWSYLPDYSSGYCYELSNIGSEVTLSNADVTEIGIHSFPVVTYDGDTMQEDVTLRQFALQATLFTLRCDSETIPVFRLLHDGESVTPDIDLASAFEYWGVIPENSVAQDYELTVTIGKDGSVDLDWGLLGSSSEWTDGGSIS